MSGERKFVPETESLERNPEEPKPVEKEPERSEREFQDAVAESLKGIGRTVREDLKQIVSDISGISRSADIPRMLKKTYRAMALLASVELTGAVLERVKATELIPEPAGFAEMFADLPPIQEFSGDTQKTLAALTADKPFQVTVGDRSDIVAFSIDKIPTDGIILSTTNSNVYFSRGVDPSVFSGLDGTWRNDNPSPDEDYPMRAYSKSFVDGFGNSVMVGYVEAGSVGNTRVFQTIYISPSLKYGDNSVVPLSVDLRSIDPALGVIDGVFKQRTLSPVATVGGIGMYSDFGQNDTFTADLSVENQRTIADSMASAYALYGLPPTSDVDRIVVTKSRDLNAAADRGVREMQFNYGLLEAVGHGISKEGFSRVVAHESEHFLSSHFGIETNSAVEAAFDSLDPETLAKFSEEHFAGGFGGHPEDNSAETVASVMVTLQDPLWQTNVNELSEKDRGAYRLVIDALVIAHEDSNIPENAPVIGMLHQKLDYLNAIE